MAAALAETDPRSGDREPPGFHDDRCLRLAPFALMAVGVLLRLHFFLSQPPLWGDEAMIAVSFNESLPSWLQGLRFYQTAPFGYLLLSSAVVRVLGDGVLALRLVPFLAGIATLIVFWRLARVLLPRPWALASLAILSLSTPAIYYSGETKQYGLDALVAVTILLAAVSAGAGNSEGPRASEGAGALVVGAIGVLFSQTAVFILAGAAIWLWIGGTRHARRVGLLWALTSGAGFFLYSATMPAGTRVVMDVFWGDAFLPFPPDLDSYWRAFTGLFDRVVGAPWPWVVGSVAAWGVIRSRDRRLWLLLLPLALATAASLLQAYPFSPMREGSKMGRLFMFALPSLAVILASGLRHAGRLAAPLTILVLSLVGVRSVRMVVDPSSVFYRPDITEAIDLIRTEPDTVVVPPHIVPLFLYYSAREGLEVDVRPADGVTGDTFERAWIYTDWVSGEDEEAFFARYCRGTCRITRLGQQILLRVEHLPGGGPGMREEPGSPRSAGPGGRGPVPWRRRIPRHCPEDLLPRNGPPCPDPVAPLADPRIG
ncbi:MAG: glycosyltransferase family 39 protein [Longimicrobiales bacterium]